MHTEAEQTDEQLNQEISKVSFTNHNRMIKIKIIIEMIYTFLFQANVICIVYSVNNKKSIEKVREFQI